MKRIGKLILCPACLILMTLTVLPADAAPTGIFVSIAPQKYFVEKIGGSLVDCSVLVPAGADPHTYEPKPRQMAALAKTAVYFAVGIDFEKAWLARIASANPGMRIVHTDAGITKIAMAKHYGEAANDRKHAGPTSHDHAGGAPDPHIWLAPALVKVQAGHILQTLVAVDPKNQSHYKTGYGNFLRELDALDGELKALFAGRKGEPFMVFHPSWGYFAQAYGLKQVPIEMEGKEPKPAQLHQIIRQARERGVKVIFVQPQFSTKSAEMLSREIGGQIALVDPLAENWAENLRKAAGKFRKAVR
ncbi:MAG: zinc ABC transporter substrate-binding protein [Deltaproteobacteria bacterium]|nr:zinc ABC transporter substrate-binding protein [Deltaproteobacteria bacterium]